jgi:hypothetical protein
MGALEILGPKEYLGVELIALADPALNLFSNCETEPCWNNKVNLWEDNVVGHELSSHTKQPVYS